MDKLISVIWVLIEQVSIYLFCCSFLQTKRPLAERWVCNCLAWGLLLLIMFFHILPFPPFICSFIVNLCIAFYAYKRSTVRIFTIVTLSILLICLSDTIFAYGGCAFLRLTLEGFYEKKLLYVAVVTTGKLSTLILTWVIYRYWSNHRQLNLTRNWFLLSLIFPSISLITLAVIYRTFGNSADLSVGAFLFSVALAIANIAVLLLISAIEKATTSSKDAVLLNQQLSLQEKNIQALEASYRAQRKSTHEFQHQMQIVENLLNSGQYEALQSYVGNLMQNRAINILSINSHNPIIDAVLNQKHLYAKEKGIDFQLHINDLSTISIPSDKLVVLLCNLLDNALEACECCSNHKEISCSLVRDFSFYIAITNTSNPVNIVGNQIETTKDDKINHGYGLPNIQKILHDLGAEYSFFYENGKFHFIAEIPL